VIALHDVAPSTLAETTRWRSIVAELTDGPVSLLVVPRYRGRDSWRAGPGPGWIRGRARAGDEAVLHGYSHLSLAGRDGRELAGRDARSVAGLIRDGVEEMRGSGLRVEGFIAPSYAHPSSTAASCRSAGLRWWATRLALFTADDAIRLPSLGLGASSATRRTLSPGTARLAARVLARAPVVRLDLHPADLRHARLEHAGRELLATLLGQDRRPLTHSALLSWRFEESVARPPQPVATG
jgi:predicted deacetylase